MIAEDAGASWFRGRAIAACFAPTGPRPVHRFNANEWFASRRFNDCEVHVLRDKINDSVKAAMKAQDKPRLAALRLMNAAIQNATIEAERAGKSLAEDDLPGPAAEDDQAAPGIGRHLRERRPQGIGRPGARRDRGDQGLPAAADVGSRGQGRDRRRDQKISARAGMKDMGKVMAALKGTMPARWTSARRAGW